MIEFLEFTFRSGWHFIGVLILLSTVAGGIHRVLATFWRHRTINKHGYPPTHCDSDGLFLPEDDIEY